MCQITLINFRLCGFFFGCLKVREKVDDSHVLEIQMLDTCFIANVNKLAIFMNKENSNREISFIFPSSSSSSI